MKEIVSFVVACMLAASASFAANEKQEQQAPVASAGMAPIVYIDTFMPN